MFVIDKQTHSIWICPMSSLDAVWNLNLNRIYITFEAASGAIPCQFSGSGHITLSNFPEILLKLSLPHMMNICKIWMKSVKKWH